MPTSLSQWIEHAMASLSLQGHVPGVISIAPRTAVLPVAQGSPRHCSSSGVCFKS